MGDNITIDKIRDRGEQVTCFIELKYNYQCVIIIKVVHYYENKQVSNKSMSVEGY